jgi:Endoplasmic reticulum protein ERp29, C-terminal domain
MQAGHPAALPVLTAYLDRFCKKQEQSKAHAELEHATHWLTPYEATWAKRYAKVMANVMKRGNSYLAKEYALGLALD